MRLIRNGPCVKHVAALPVRRSGHGDGERIPETRVRDREGVEHLLLGQRGGLGYLYLLRGVNVQGVSDEPAREHGLDIVLPGGIHPEMLSERVLGAESGRRLYDPQAPVVLLVAHVPGIIDFYLRADRIAVADGTLAVHL